MCQERTRAGGEGTKSWNYRIFGLEGSFKDHFVLSPAMNRYLRFPRAPSKVSPFSSWELKGKSFHGLCVFVFVRDQRRWAGCHDCVTVTYTHRVVAAKPQQPCPSWWHGQAQISAVPWCHLLSEDTKTSGSGPAPVAYFSVLLQDPQLLQIPL